MTAGIWATLGGGVLSSRGRGGAANSTTGCSLVRIGVGTADTVGAGAGVAGAVASDSLLMLACCVLASGVLCWVATGKETGWGLDPAAGGN